MSVMRRCAGSLSDVQLPVRTAAEVILAKRKTKALARQLGFDEISSDELAVVASELASNLCKHAGGGEFIVRKFVECGREGLEIVTRDRGPGIGDIQEALADGYSTVGSLGVGLGVASRIMDGLTIVSPVEAGRGARVVARRWLDGEAQAMAPHCELEIGVAERPCPQMASNGDACVVLKWSSQVLVAVIDGVGHGPVASRASQLAAQYLRRHAADDMHSLFRGVHKTCVASRGVVMALLHFDCGRRRMHHACVGNIVSRYWGDAERFELPVRRGVLGVNMPARLYISHRSITANDIFAVHSDGVNSSWHWHDVFHKADRSMNDVARQLLIDYQRPGDDATVALVKVSET